LGPVRIGQREEAVKDKHVGMLMGGGNAEHEVSLKTGAALAKALRSRGYRVTDVLVGEDLAQVLLREKIEVAFVALHGRWGEDGCVQGLLEAMRIPYTGCGVLASALAMDKIYAKRIFKAIGLPVAEDLVVEKKAVGEFDPSTLPFGYPVVVKPAREGSSVGISIARDVEGLVKAVETAAGFAGDILLERYIKGREINVGILDDQALGALEVVPAEEFYDYKAKYHSGGTTQYLFPAPLDEEQNRRVLDLALRAHRALGCSGVSRVEAILDERGDFFMLEVNTIPGMTEASLIPKIARGVGISFEDLAERLLLGASLKA
jgi:D-alanine-D-alanine ligase